MCYIESWIIPATAGPEEGQRPERDGEKRLSRAAVALQGVDTTISHIHTSSVSADY